MLHAHTNFVQFTLFMLESFALGAVIGAERQWRNRTAGLRTNTLVAVGATGFVMIGQMTSGGDSIRIAAQVVSGIGFLGAGVILREGLSIRGLNTAATMWCSAAVGALCGMGFSREAAVFALFVLFANIALRPVARKLERTEVSLLAETGSEMEYLFRFRGRSNDEAHLRSLLVGMTAGTPLVLRALTSEDVDQTGIVEVRAELLSSGRQDGTLEQFVSRLSLEPSVTAVSWEVVQRARDSE
ncbi:MAG: MgtC/SapB family protein [Acidobacteriaceae bacterium]|nr:MgtC/SapB family protein [Acidobacteriaceae bacterium]